MASSKAIRKQIASVTSTSKITSAMEMVAASKMRRAQEQMQHARPYADAIAHAVRELANAAPEYRPAFLRDCPEEEIRAVAFLVVSSEKGLCGGLNVNLFKRVVLAMHEEEGRGRAVRVCTVGAKARSFFSRIGADMEAASLARAGERCTPEELFGATGVVFDAVRNGEVQRVYLAYNSFVNTMTQQPQLVRLLPPEPEEMERDPSTTGAFDYIYEPDAHELLDEFMLRYVESVIYRAVVENFACEQAAKMIAMKNATENAGDLIESLTLAYNNARQASITQELAEIIGGAEAL